MPAFAGVPAFPLAVAGTTSLLEAIGGGIRVAFARDSAFDIEGDGGEEGPSLSPDELDTALDEIDFAGILALGAGRDRSEEDGSASAASAEPSIEDPGAAQASAEPIAPGRESPARRAAPIVCEASALSGGIVSELVVRGRRHLAIGVPEGLSPRALLRTLAGLVRPRRGELWIFGHPFHSMTDEERARARASLVGFVLEDVPLIESLTLAENVVTQALTARLPGPEVPSRLDALLDRLELSGDRERFPSELDGLARARAEIARAMIHEPPLLVVDLTRTSFDAEDRSAICAALESAVADTLTTLVLACPGGKKPSFVEDIVGEREPGSIELPPIDLEV